MAESKLVQLNLEKVASYNQPGNLSKPTYTYQRLTVLGTPDNIINMVYCNLTYVDIQMKL